MKGTNRTKVAAYLAAQRHLREDLRGAKTLTLMAAELSTTKSTVRRWLRRDHWDLWMDHFASVYELWEARRDDTAHACLVNLPANGSTVHSEKFMAELNRSLLELTDADQIV